MHAMSKQTRSKMHECAEKMIDRRVSPQFLSSSTFSFVDEWETAPTNPGGSRKREL